MSPLMISILLHCHTRPGPFSDTGISKDAPAVREAIAYLHNVGLICLVPDNESRWGTTKMGEAHVLQLRKLPLPKQAWVGYDGRMIRDDK